MPNNRQCTKAEWLKAFTSLRTAVGQRERVKYCISSIPLVTDTTTPASNFMKKKIAAKLTRRQVSILIQLRTGHVPLQAYLHWFKLAKTPTCPSCGIEPETVSHFLLHCVTYVVQRRWLRRSLGRDQSLGLEILGNEKRMKSLMAYIKDTKRFKESHGDLQHPLAEQNDTTRWQNSTRKPRTPPPLLSSPSFLLFLLRLFFFLSLSYSSLCSILPLLFSSHFFILSLLHYMCYVHSLYSTLYHYHILHALDAHKPPQEATTVGVR